MHKLAPRCRALLIGLIITISTAASAQNLPDFGSPADSVLTKSREKLLGDSVVLQLRRAGAVVDDPQLNEYIRLLGSQLGSYVNDGDFDFEFLMIDEQVINAFAMPGGVIGINVGLLLATENESELAGVLAHEISHVTQRHIARSLYEQQRSSVMSIAATIAAILLASSSESGGEAAMGAAMASQAALVQQQINFTRANEQEADRIGIDVLALAGFDPMGMASFFEKLSRRESRSADIIPEMLRTHPTSSGRISEARARARQLPQAYREESLAYGLAKARARVIYADRPQTALDYFRRTANSNAPADRYGLALSLSRAGRGDEAERMFRELITEHPGVIAFQIGRAEALLSFGLDEQALAVYREANRLSPRNTPLVVSYAEALLQAGQPDEAHDVLLDLLNNVRPAPAQIELLARTANAEGDMVNAHHYMAEYFISIGDPESAIIQLQRALSQPDINSVQTARFNSRIEEFEEFLAESRG